MLPDSFFVLLSISLPSKLLSSIEKPLTAQREAVNAWPLRGTEDPKIPVELSYLVRTGVEIMASGLPGFFAYLSCSVASLFPTVKLALEAV